MEALPRLPMLSFDFRPYYPKNAQFGPDIMNLIKQCYQEDPNNYVEEIQQLEKLRQQAMKVNKDIEGCNLLKRYFCQLYFLQKRFPMLKDTGNNAEISWKDVLTNANSKKIDYRSEFTVTLYNIGALHTQLGASDDRTTAEGLKLACTHFQCAAWAFQYLQEITAVNVRSDFDPGFLQFLISVCLAQAQECIAEKSITDNRKPNISAKVVAQICDYYGTAMNALTLLKQEDSIIVDCGMKNSHVWLNYIKFKKPYYECITNLFMGMVAEEEEKMGERVAYFESAADKLKTAIYNFKHIDILPFNKGLDEALSFTRDIVEGKRKNALSENDFIYHDAIPAKDNLPKVTGAVLVKCIGFDLNDLEISGPDIFAKLISMKVHKLSSVYSEEKAQLLRRVSAAVEEKNTELNRIMQSFKLDYLNSSEDPNSLPEDLIDKCAAFQAKPNLIDDLDSKMDELEHAHNDIKRMMNEMMQFIEKEEAAEEEFQIVMNSTSRPRSIVSTDLKCQANRYMEALEKTVKSNESLRDAIADNKDNFEILALPPSQLEKQLSRVSFDYSTEERNVVQELQRLVDKVEEMKTQRALLMLQLRDSLRNDDITDQLALNDEDRNAFPAMIQKEIGKHQNVANLIDQNLKAQENILNALTNAYAAYAPIRKIISDTSHKRSEQMNSLIRSSYMYNQLQEKTGDGLNFYSKLRDNVSKLLSRVTSACNVQHEEREQIYENTGKRPPKKNFATRPIPNGNSVLTAATPTMQPVALKLKDYLDHKRMSKHSNSVSLPSAYASQPQPQSLSNRVEESGGYAVASVNAADTSSYSRSRLKPTFVSDMTSAGPTFSDLPKDVHNAAAATATYSYTQPYAYSYQNVVPASYVTTSSLTFPTNTTLTNSPASAYYAAGAATYGAAQNSYTNQVAHTSSYGYNVAHQQNAYSNVTHTAYYTPQPNKPTYPNASQTGYGVPASSVTSNAYATRQQVASHHAFPARTNGNTLPNYAAAASPYYNAAVGNANTNIPYSASPNSLTSSAYSNFTPHSTRMVTNQTFPISESQANNFTSASAAVTPQQAPTSNNIAYSYSNYNSNASVIGTNQTSHPVSNLNASSVSSTAAASLQDGHNGGTPANYYSQSNYSYGAAGAVVSATANYSGSNYHYGNTSTGSGTYHHHHHHHHQQPLPVPPSHRAPQNKCNMPSTTVNYVSIDCVSSYNSSNYTNAGHHNTANIESSSKSHDGRSYALQYATSPGNTSNDNGNVSSNGHSNDSSSRRYYSMQYGHQYSNSEQLADHSPPKHTSMTYMQAGINENKVTMSTSQSGTTPTAETKSESNLDLLADLDFNVSDQPLLPTAATNETIIQQLTNLDLNSSSTETTTTDNAIIKENNTKLACAGSNAFDSKEYLERFIQEAEKFEKFVEKLTVKTLNGSIPLDIMWNEYNMQQERLSNMHTTSEAQKYQDKNRSMDSVPYDASRVTLSQVQPDYINASFLNVPNASAPNMIVAQAPLRSTMADFWLMIWQQEVELIVCLLSEKEIPCDEIYWPKEKNKRLEVEDSVITLLSINVQPHFTERILSVMRDGTTRIVTHTQISSWSEETFVESANSISQLVRECLSFYYDQRDLQHRILLHCDQGVGRTGVLAALFLFNCDIASGKGVPDLMATLMLLSDGRKKLINHKKHLQSTFQLTLCSTRNIIDKYGVRTSFPPAMDLPNASRTESSDISPSKTVPAPSSESESEGKPPGRLLSKEENKRRNMERFSVGGNLETLTEAAAAAATAATESDDPFSSIDPLWPIKKELS